MDLSTIAAVIAGAAGHPRYEHLRRHDLMHTGLTWMDAGVPVHVFRKIAGHAR